MRKSPNRVVDVFGRFAPRPRMAQVAGPGRVTFAVDTGRSGTRFVTVNKVNKVTNVIDDVRSGSYESHGNRDRPWNQGRPGGSAAPSRGGHPFSPRRHGDRIHDGAA